MTSANWSALYHNGIPYGDGYSVYPLCTAGCGKLGPVCDWLPTCSQHIPGMPSTRTSTNKGAQLHHSPKMKPWPTSEPLFAVHGQGPEASHHKQQGRSPTCGCKSKRGSALGYLE